MHVEHDGFGRETGRGVGGRGGDVLNRQRSVAGKALLRFQLYGEDRTAARTDGAIRHDSAVALVPAGQAVCRGDAHNLQALRGYQASLKTGEVVAIGQRHLHLLFRCFLGQEGERGHIERAGERTGRDDGVDGVHRAAIGIGHVRRSDVIADEAAARTALHVAISNLAGSSQVVGGSYPEREDGA